MSVRRREVSTPGSATATAPLDAAELTRMLSIMLEFGWAATAGEDPAPAVVEDLGRHVVALHEMPFTSFAYSMGKLGGTIFQFFRLLSEITEIPLGDLVRSVRAAAEVASRGDIS